MAAGRREEIEVVEVLGEAVADWRPALTAHDRRLVDEAKAELRQNLGIMRMLREQLGLTQEELAQLLGVSQSNVSKMERRTAPPLSALRKLVEHGGGRLLIAVELNGRRTELPIEWVA